MPSFERRKKLEALNNVINQSSAQRLSKKITDNEDNSTSNSSRNKKVLKKPPHTLGKSTK
jgi:hypothetical protein